MLLQVKCGRILKVYWRQQRCKNDQTWQWASKHPLTITIHLSWSIVPELNPLLTSLTTQINRHLSPLPIFLENSRCYFEQRMNKVQDVATIFVKCFIILYFPISVLLDSVGPELLNRINASKHQCATIG